LQGADVRTLYIVSALLGFGTGFGPYLLQWLPSSSVRTSCNRCNHCSEYGARSLTLVSLLFTQLQNRVDYVTAGWITGIVS
jgi:hypothetical protein